MVEAEKVGLRVIDVRHEATAVFAADAMSRLSGTTGVAVVTAGPGLTKFLKKFKFFAFFVFLKKIYLFVILF